MREEGGGGGQKTEYRCMMHTDRVRSQHGDGVHKHRTLKLLIRERHECVTRRKLPKRGKGEPDDVAIGPPNADDVRLIGREGP